MKKYITFLTQRLLKLWLPVIFFLLIGNQNSFAQTFWWNDAVFYEVFVRSFKDSDGDGKGDFIGLIQKLDYLNDGDPTTHHDLGVTGIWLMPIQQSPSYHGYDVVDYRTIEQDYGTNEDFKTFMTEAHKRGIKVIVDYVVNHTSTEHPWFLSSTNPLSDKRNWYIWQNTNPGTTQPWGGTSPVWHYKNNSYYYGVFWSGMPDLNYNTAEVKEEMFDVAKFWLEDMNVDGFRLDAIKYIKEVGNTLEDTPETIQFLKDFRTFYKAIDEDALAVGEAWTTTEKIKPYVENGGLDFCFEFDLADAILAAANTGNVSGLKSQVDEVMTTYPFLQFGTFLTNHDIDRVMNKLGSNTSKAKVAADLLLTLPGIPFIYYGEEIGMTGVKPDENIRKPLQWNGNAQAGFTTGTPWRAVNADYTTKNIQSQQLDVSSLWHNYRKLIAIRNNQNALRKGTYKAITASAANTFAFLRQYENENIIVVSNTSSSMASGVQISLEAGSITEGSYLLVELQGGNQIALEIDNTGGFTNLSLGNIPARSTLIYKLFSASEINTTVTFQVDMNAMINSGAFISASETVDIVADFNDFGNDAIINLTDVDEDGIYSVTISNVLIGSKINFKYRINAINDGREEFPASTYLRQHLVLEGINTVTDVYQKQNVTGVERSLKQAINVYPVPTNKELIIEYSEGFSGLITYSISDLLGVKRITSSFSSSALAGDYNLSCEGLSTGVYLLTVEYKGASEVFRIVVQK